MQSNSSEYPLLALLSEYKKTLSAPSMLIPSLGERDKLQAWTLDLFPEIKCSLHTRTLSCLYLDAFLIAKPDTNPTVYHLLAMTIFTIALKFEENTIISPQEISLWFDKAFSEDAIRTLELYILKTLNWKLLRITPAYIGRLLLEVTCDSNDYSKIMQKVEVFSLIGLLNSHIARKGEFLLAAAAVSLALSTMGFGAFLEEWWTEITKYVNISRQQVRDIEICILEIINKD